MAASGSPRKQVKAKRALPTLPPTPTDHHRLKTVTFNDETYETSIGGTEYVGKIKQDVLLHFDAPVNISMTTLVNKVSNSAKPSSKTLPSAVVGKENEDVQSNITMTNGHSSGEEPVQRTSNGNSANSVKSSGANVGNSAGQKAAVSKAGSPRKAVKPSAAAQSGSAAKGTRRTSGLSGPAKSRPVKNPKTAEAETISENSSSSATTKVGNSSRTSESHSDSSYELPNRMSQLSDEAAQGPPVTPRMRHLTAERPVLEHVSGERRTTMDRIDSVSLTPFQTPRGKQSRRHTLESRIFATPDCYSEVNLGTPRRMLPMIQDESLSEGVEEEGEDSCSITVAVRVRPFSQRSVQLFL